MEQLRMIEAFFPAKHQTTAFLRQITSSSAHKQTQARSDLQAGERQGQAGLANSKQLHDDDMDVGAQ